MKNKITTVLQDVVTIDEQFIEYATYLAKDYQLHLELFARSPRVYNKPVFTTVAVDGFSTTSQMVQRKVLDHKIDVLSELTSDIKDTHDEVAWKVQVGPLKESIKKMQKKSNSKLTLISQKSSDGVINEWFGTLETDVAKSTKKPLLIIPENITYTKPKKLLILARGLPEINIDQINDIKESFGLEISYVFVEESEKLSLEKIMKQLNIDFSEFVGSVRTVSTDYIANDFDNIIEKEKPDWVSFFNFDRSFFDRLTKLSTNKLVLSSELPCLAL